MAQESDPAQVPGGAQAPIQVLIVGGQPELVDKLQAWLEEIEGTAVNLEHIPNVTAAEKRLAGPEAYVVLLDLASVTEPPTNVVKRISSLSPNSALFVISDSDDTSSIGTLLHTGAQDCLLIRDLNPGVFKHRLQIAVARIQNNRGFEGDTGGDVLFRRRVEENLRVSEANLATLIENMDDLIVLHAIDQRLVEFNSAFARIIERISGVLPQKGMQPEDYNLAEMVPYWRNLHQRVLGGEKISVEYVHDFGDGVARSWDVRLYPVVEDDRVIGLVNIGRETTNRRQAEERLRSSEREKAAILDGLTEMVTYYQDANLEIRWANHSAGASLDLGQEELVGRHCYHLWYQRDTPCDECPALECLRTGQATSAQRSTPDGKTWLLNVSPVKDTQGKVLGVVVATLDVTARVRAEEALARRTEVNEALRRVALDVTVELDQEKLLHTIVVQAIELVNAREGGLYLHSPEQGVLEWALAEGEQQPILGNTLRYGECLAGKVWESNTPIIVDDYRQWEGRADNDEGLLPASVIGVPIRWASDFMGVLVIIDQVPRVFTPEDAESLTLCATQAAVALRNSQLHLMEHQQRQLAEALADAAAVVSSTLDLDEVLDRILEQVARVVDGDAFNIMLVEDGVARPVRWRGYGQFGPVDAIAGITFNVADISGFKQIVETGDPIVFSNVFDYDGWETNAQTEWLRSFVAAPILIGGEVVGFLDVDGTRTGQFGEEDGKRLAAFSSYAAIALQNAKMYEQARRDAETKAMLLSEVNHRVKNNLSAIIGLLYAEERFAAQDERSDYRPIIEDLVGRIQGLATVHSMLSAAQWSSIELRELADNVIETALQVLPPYKNVWVEICPVPVDVSPQQANSIALVINELTTNTIKHALLGRDTARVKVNILLQDGRVMFEYSDDGPGYPESVLAWTHHSVGMYLLKAIVQEDLNGQLILENDGGAKTRVWFSYWAGS